MPPRPSLARAITRATVTLLAGALAARAVLGCVHGRDCALVGCEQGLEVTFVKPYSDPGSYRIVVGVDDATATCTFVVPPPTSATTRICDRDDVGVHFGFPDGASAASSRVVTGLGITSTDAKSVSIEVSKDGQVLATGSFTPEYAASPGPNGADCDPKSCVLARRDFP